MQFVMGWPEWIIISLIVISSVTRAPLIHNQKTAETKIGYLIGIIIRPFLWLSLLYWGGLFS